MSNQFCYHSLYFHLHHHPIYFELRDSMWHTPPSTNNKLWILVLALVACSIPYGIRMCDAAAITRRAQETECTYNGSTCTCDYGTMPGDSCTFTNAAGCLNGCEDKWETCNNQCQNYQENCGDDCVDIGSFQCVCSCLAATTDCKNTCKRAYNTCTCGCEPPSEPPTRAPTRSIPTTTAQTAPASVPSSTEDAASSNGNSVSGCTIATTGTKYAALAAVVVAVYAAVFG